MAIFNTVYGGEWKWKPWSNTMAYRPLEENGNDYSSNWNNLTNFAWVTFSTLSSWKKYAIFSGTETWNTCKAYTSSTSTTNYWTFSVWAKPENNWNNHYFMFTSWSQTSTSVNFRLITAWASTYQVASNSSNHTFSSYSSSVSPINDWNWHHFVVTISASTISLYIDNVLKGSTTNSTPNETGTGVMSLWTYVDTGGTSDFWYKWWFSEAIFEKSIWTTDDISSYYNKTKKNYWL